MLFEKSVAKLDKIVHVLDTKVKKSLGGTRHPNMANITVHLALHKGTTAGSAFCHRMIGRTVFSFEDRPCWDSIAAD